MTNETTETITIGTEVGKKVNCSMCGKEGTTDEFVIVQGPKGVSMYVCAECRVKSNEAFETETQNPNLPLAVIGGCIGAVAGAAVWYLVAMGTGKEIGYISLGLGYLVGMGVYLGSGRKRGKGLQAISAVIALIAIFVTEKFLFDYFLNEYIQQHISEFPEMANKAVSIPFFDPNFLKALVSPIGLLIYVIGIYFASTVCRPRRKI